MKIKILPAIICLACVLLKVFPSLGQTTSWKGTGAPNWNIDANWTNNAPTASVDAIIGDASFTGSTQPTISAVAVAKSITIGGIKASQLTVSNTLTVSGDIIINSNGTLSNGNSAISLTGSWINNGTFTPGTSTTTFRGTGGISGNPIQNFYDLVVAGWVDLLSSGTVEIHDLTINTGYSLLLDGATLQIAGTVNSTGTFDASAGIIELNGAATQTIPENTFLGNAVDQLIISNSSLGGVLLAGAVDVYGSLTYSAAGLLLTTNDYLTLKSTEFNTAWLGDMTGKTIAGKVTVERYLFAQKGWRFLSVPTNSMQTVNDTWQEGSSNTGDDPVPTYGTQITGPYGTSAGFDLYTSTPSMKTYNSATDSWVGIPNTTTSGIKSFDGYMVFVRGDRLANAFTSSSTPTVLRTKGNLYTGDQNPIMVNANEFASIGNPYASKVNMRFIASSGLKDYFYIWDPKLGGSGGLGGYQVFAKNADGDYLITPGEGSYEGSSSGSVYNYIQSGLAFLVQADVLGGSLTFNEAAKTKDLVSRPSGLPPPQLSTSLYGVNTDNSTYLIDGVLNNYDDSYSNNVDGRDAIKLSNSGENLSIKTANTLLAVERRHGITEKDTVFLNLANTKVQQYRFQFTAAQLDQQGLMEFLEDNYTHTSTPLNLNGSTIVDFNIENITGSIAADRFRIVFRPALVLPLCCVTSIKAWQKNKEIAIEWKVDNEINMMQYNVEKSVDGNHYTTAEIVAAANKALSNYNWLDISPSQGYNYYRIQSTDVNGKKEYSTVVKVFMGKGKGSISIYPNPVINGTINLQLTNQPAGVYGIRLFNKMGQVMISKQINHTEGSSTETIRLDKSSVRGIYQLEITKPDENKINMNVIY
jgi:hypothetical protein